MINSTEIYENICRKQNDESWKSEEISDEGSSFLISTINQHISLKDVYRNVKF